MTETRMLLQEVSIRTVNNRIGLQMWYFQIVTKTLPAGVPQLIAANAVYLISST